MSRFPDMARELDAPLNSLSWVLTAYAIVYAALLVVFTKPWALSAAASSAAVSSPP